MRVSRSALAWLSVFVSLTASSAVKAQIVVDTCGQIVNGAGLLTADLDCSAESVAAGVVLTGTLYLEGFTLTAPMGGDAVGCGDKCRVQGPGTVRGHVASFGGVVKLSGLSMDGSPLQYAVGHPLKLKLVGVTMSGYDSAIEAQGRMKIVDSQLTGSGVGSGFYGGSGIVGERIGLIRSSVTGFAFNGITAFVYARLVDSIVTGNGIDPACSGTYNCSDVYSYTLPRLRGTSTCGTSWGNVGGPWGVCTGD